MAGSGKQHKPAALSMEAARPYRLFRGRSKLLAFRKLNVPRRSERVLSEPAAAESNSGA